MNQGFKINFQPLYRVAQFLALTMLILIPLQIVIYVIAPPPDTVKGFFELYQQNPFLGLLSLDFLYLFNNMIIVIIYLALFVLLYREKPVIVLLALILGLIGIACYYPSNPAFEMLTLSNQYFQALPEQQTIYLAAGEALMAGYTGTTFDVYYVLSTICLLLFAYALIKSHKFKKSVGLWGLASGFFMIVPSSAGVLGMIFSLLSLIPWVVFIALLMINFRKFAADTSF
ncbi:DUF4386 family protein [Sinanaerobacter chloroacetimidivorans]|uniref:DUF4386 family protein n=1 Tax=Sinanaerobacter chloroacetimidivorans TaxID=2818044 RepID=A0A8J8B3G5_9FIRM|nr:DUF4386 family protein [Sinanaerobacter chloroacetimidivorans]MBR0600324.1 DUF4386 family protein [Sinanaerobacter chloroacetimidivorans]